MTELKEEYNVEICDYATVSYLIAQKIKMIGYQQEEFPQYMYTKYKGEIAIDRIYWWNNSQWIGPGKYLESGPKIHIASSEMILETYAAPSHMQAFDWLYRQGYDWTRILLARIPFTRPTYFLLDDILLTMINCMAEDRLQERLQEKVSAMESEC